MYGGEVVVQAAGAGVAPVAAHCMVLLLALVVLDLPGCECDINRMCGSTFLYMFSCRPVCLFTAFVCFAAVYHHAPVGCSARWFGQQGTLPERGDP